jgi:HSP20 family protein
MDVYHYPSRHLQGRPMKNFDMFFDDYFNFPESFHSESNTGFSVDIIEREDGYTVEAEMPGFSKEDISVCAEGGQIILSAKRTDRSDDQDQTYLKRERGFGQFQRIFYLNDLDEQNITAEYKDGLLKIEAKKESQKSRKKTRIAIT